MTQFILTDILFLAFGSVLYLMIRALPRVEEGKRKDEKRTVFERWIMSEIPHKIDQALNTTLGKTLRKLKVVLLRIDNYLTEHLKKISRDTNGGNLKTRSLTGRGLKPKIDFSDLGSASNDKEVVERRSGEVV